MCLMLIRKDTALCVSVTGTDVSGADRGALCLFEESLHWLGCELTPGSALVLFLSGLSLQRGGIFTMFVLCFPMW